MENGKNWETKDIFTVLERKKYYGVGKKYIYIYIFKYNIHIPLQKKFKIIFRFSQINELLVETLSKQAESQNVPLLRGLLGCISVLLR